MKHFKVNIVPRDGLKYGFYHDFKNGSVVI